MKTSVSKVRKQPMVIVVPPEAVSINADGDAIADPGAWYGRVGRVKYCATISRHLIEMGSAWTPSEPLPIPPERAGKLARTALARIAQVDSQWSLSAIPYNGCSIVSLSAGSMCSNLTGREVEHQGRVRFRFP